MLIGLLLGIVIGLAIGPLLRSWLAWREYVEASREARLTEDILRRMSESTPPSHVELPHTTGSPPAR
jgi:hypothetical protein